MSDKDDAEKALYRLFDQAFNTAGDEAGRRRASADYLTVRDALAHIDPSLKMTSAEWQEALAHAWDLGRRAERRDWELTFDLVTPDEDRQPWTNPYRSSDD